MKAPDASDVDGSAASWATDDPDRLVGRGHPIGEFLEAWRWQVLEREDGHVSVSAHLPEHVHNPRGELFGGFTATYVDFISLHAVHAKAGRPQQRHRLGLVTLALRIDYLEPVVGPTFVLDSRVEASRGATDHVITKFLHDDTVAVLATTTLRTIDRDTAR